MRKQTFIGLCTLLLFVTQKPTAWAWDAHNLVTENSLKSLSTKNPALWQKLNRTITVTSLEGFIEKAFGSSCLSATDTPQKKRVAIDRILNGVGKDFVVQFVEAMGFNIDIDWAKGNSWLRLLPIPGVQQPNRQGLGETVKPAEVLAIYSDEPDWLMDDDVPRLKGKGLSKTAEGMGTRVLRHFWNEGETISGTDRDLHVDQETDERAQMMYELALIAFAKGEHYWGYRFLANSIHYLEDMTQPFHIKAIPSYKMINTVEVLRGLLCDKKREKGEKNPENCPPELTVDNIVIKYGWVIGAYHGIYEDFARGLLKKQRYASEQYMGDWSGLGTALNPEELTWDYKLDILDLKEAIHSAQKIMLPFAEKVADRSLKTFGTEYKLEEPKQKEEVLKSGKDIATGYRLATLIAGGDTSLELKPGQQQAISDLAETTNELFARTGKWNREFIEHIENTRDKIISGSTSETINTRLDRDIESLVEKYKNQCLNP